MARTAVSKISCWEMSLDRLYIYMAATSKGALQIGLSLEKRGDCVAFFKKLFPYASLVKDYDLNRQLAEGIEAALLSRHPGKDLDLDFSCTPFQWRVYEAIRTIPFGETRTYKEVGAMVGRPKGARAVGRALGQNPLPLIFP
jgi:AraC family transcriptional regulator of adaptative response/methylated-DNA-[protein]-cysteine methyltransferase